MLFLRYSLAGLLLLTATAPAGSAEAPAADLAWAEALLLGSPDATAEQVRTALVAVKAQAAGLLDQPATREAAFVLARYWALQIERPEAAARSQVEAIRSISAVATLFPDDPRTAPLLRQLVRLQVAAGDCFGAHVSFTRLLDSDLAHSEAGLGVWAAFCAAEINDFAMALKWSRQIDEAGLAPAERTRLDCARLMAEEALGRLDVALESARRLEEQDPDALRLDRRVLLAAARARESAALLEPAVRDYATYVDVFPAAPDRPAILLHLGTLLGRMGRLDEGQRNLDLLIEKYPASTEADLARLASIELDGGSADATQVDDYLAVLRATADIPGMRRAAERMTDRFIAAGLSLELLMGYARLLREEGNGVLRMVVHAEATEALELILALLISREDDVAIAAASVQAAQLGLRLPEGQLAAVQAARRQLGLPALDTGDELVTILDEVRDLLRRSAWPAAVDRLLAALEAAPRTSSAQEVEARRLLATALWRADRSAEALEVVADVLQRPTLEAPTRRSFQVLQADLLFSTGKHTEACVAYREALASEASTWVTAQVQRCDENLPSANLRSGT